ncbi:MAG: hypothetical protein ACPGJE_06590 [Wenzhouxiangellaceae bacterium]
MKISMRSGVDGWFDVDDITIRFWASAWTGREIVWIQNGSGEHVVSDKRSFRFKTPHEFNHGGHRYRLEYRIGATVVEIQLFRDGELIDSDLYDNGSLRVDPETGRLDWRSVLKKIGPALVAGALGGAAIGYLIGSLFK